MINCLETISINFPSEHHSTTWMDRRSSESRRGLVALDVVSTEAFQWPAFHPSTCHGRGPWTHQGPQHQVFVWHSSIFCRCCCFSVQLFTWFGLVWHVFGCFFFERNPASSSLAPPRPRRALDETEASICQNLLSIAMNMDVLFYFGPLPSQTTWI